MYERLASNIREHIPLTDEELNICKTLFQPKKMRKKQFLLQEGEVCKYIVFVEKGLLRSYTTDNKGGEHILQFSAEGWWMADLYSFFTDEISQYNIEALEECELLMINKHSWDVLLEKVPVLERYFRILLQNNLIATQRRLIGVMSETAEEKYLKLIRIYPDCQQRLPQHMIASYLGISRETLSRIRHQLASKK